MSKCGTAGCTADAADRITYVLRGEPATDDVCTECADGYERRPVLTDFQREDLRIVKARDIGSTHGRNAASWVFGGNTDRATYERLLKGIEDGDPEVMDAYRVPDLSGEFADEFTAEDLQRDLGIEIDWTAEDTQEASELADEAASAWEQSASEAFWQEIERMARYHLEPEAEAG